MRRSGFFLSLAAGFLASIALSAPTQAGTIFEVDADVFVTAGTATSATVQFVGTPSGPVTILPSTSLPGGVSASVVGGNVVVTFGAATHSGSPYDLEISVMGTSDLAGIGGTIGGPAGHQGGVVVLATTAAVPEPTSVALLGVGMAGFFAFRRMFKRPATA
jgi:hypothetical protein